jgi:hypothetical protein
MQVNDIGREVPDCAFGLGDLAPGEHHACRGSKPRFEVRVRHRQQFDIVVGAQQFELLAHVAIFSPRDPIEAVRDQNSHGRAAAAGRKDVHSATNN